MKEEREPICMPLTVLDLIQIELHWLHNASPSLVPSAWCLKQIELFHAALVKLSTEKNL